MASPPDYLPLTENGDNRDQIIQTYFHLGFSYEEIVVFLQLYNGITIGLRQLKRILKRRGLWRRKEQSDIRLVIEVIERELQNSGRDLGYRSMHARITKNHHLVVSREAVRLILARLDPEGVLNRKRQRLRRRVYDVPGPNYIWHLDGWDKLKQFGMCVHGCIDGYSRKLIWLEASSTNNDPFVVCKYFFDCIKRVNGLPNIVRADNGTENVNIEIMQTLLRTENNDDRGRLHTSFLYGKSTANQRIESWWSKFRSFGMNSWIDHFKSLQRNGIISTTNELDTECIIFCYLDLLRREIQLCLRLWNTHYIRKSSSQLYGKPDIMYYLPELYGGRDYIRPLNEADADILSEILTEQIPNGRSHYRELLKILTEEGQMVMPNTLDEAADLLVFLLDCVHEELDGE